MSSCAGDAVASRAREGPAQSPCARAHPLPPPAEVTPKRLVSGEPAAALADFSGAPSAAAGSSCARPAGLGDLGELREAPLGERNGRSRKGAAPGTAGEPLRAVARGAREPAAATCARGNAAPRQAPWRTGGGRHLMSENPNKAWPVLGPSGGRAGAKGGGGSSSR